MSNVRSGDIASLKTGPFGTQFSAKEYTTVGIPVINVKNIGYGEVIEDELDYISEQTRDRLSEHILLEGDIVFGRKGSVDRHAYIDEEYAGWLQGSDCIRVRCSDGINKKYVSHYLKLDHIKKMVNNAAVGSTMASMNTDILKDIEIILPELTTQNKIEKIISLLESKICLNKKINDNLEQQLKLLYDYWFVQFDFPDEQGNPYRSFGGKMVWNDLLKREIPATWGVSSFEQLCNFRNGINYDNSVIGDKIYRIVNVRNITSSSFLLNTSELDEICLPQVQADKYCITNHDIIVARSGTPGATRLLLNPCDSTIFSGFIICCSPIKERFRLYMTYHLKKLEGTSATKTGGSILQNVSQDTLKALMICVPPNEIIEKYNEHASKALNTMQKILSQNQKLARLRDWLLPMLMNGQVTIDD